MDLDLLLKSIQDELHQSESPSLLQLVEILAGRHGQTGGPSIDMTQVTAGLTEAISKSPFPGRYVWALGKIPSDAMGELESALSRTPSSRVDEEFLWQSVVAFQNLAEQQICDQDPRSVSVVKQIQKHYRRLESEQPSGPLAPIRRTQIERFLSTRKIL